MVLFRVFEVLGRGGPGYLRKRPDPTSELTVGSILDLTLITPSILLRRILVLNPVRTGGVRHANMPWMIHISGLDAEVIYIWSFTSCLLCDLASVIL